MGYLYEAMDRAKESIRSYYVGKGTPGHNRHMMLWDLIDTHWTGMLHRHIHAVALFLNPAFSYKCKFDFDGEVSEGLISCLNRMVPNEKFRENIIQEMEVYRESNGLFGYDDVIRNRIVSLPSK